MEKQNFTTPMEQLRADASAILICVGKLKDLRYHLDSVEANIKKKSQELELKEKELQNLSSDFEKRVERFEAEKAEAGDLKKLVDELWLKRNELTAKLDISTKIQREIELESKHLVEVKERQREVEDETVRKTKDLELVLVKIEESDEKLEEMSREVELKKKELQILNVQGEAELKKKQLGETKTVLVKHNGVEEENLEEEAAAKEKSDGLQKEIEEKRKELDSVKTQVKSWERKLMQLRKKIDDSKAELSSRKDQVGSSKNVQGEGVELKKKQLGLTKTVLVKHNGVEEESLVNEANHPPIIYTYQRREN